MRKTTINAYGKINLFLSVGALRADRKHEVLTVLHRVGIYDTVTVSEKRSDGIKLTCSDKTLPTDGKNLAYAAAELYFEKAGIRYGIAIDIEKRIPSTAGMGGGSSDAAAVLTALNELYGALSFNELHGIASSLGADVPFFLYGVDAMLGAGCGTELTPCRGVGFPLFGVFVRYGVKKSTGAAYMALDEKKGDTPLLKTADALLAALEKNDVSAVMGAIENDFELISEHFGEVETALASFGAERSLLCGSGPTVCGLFLSEADAENASKKLPYPSFVARIGA